MFSSAYAFSTLGASLTVALALLGQTIFSLAVDGTGFLGRTRHPFTPRSVPGLALAGILIDFAAEGFFDLGKLAGIFVLLLGLAANSFLANRSLGAPRPDLAMPPKVLRKAAKNGK